MNKVSNDSNQWVGVKATSKKDGEFVVPVIDARTGGQSRKRANAQINGSNRSKFMPNTYSAGGNCYQVSQKSK